jgi:cysteinyl-tRNA synthetase
MYFVGGHYRQPIEFDDARLEEAAASIERIREVARRLVVGESPEWSAPLKERFFDALAKDFNTPAALAAVFEWVRAANREHETGADVGAADLREMLGVLALENLLDVQEAEAPAEVTELVEAREKARAGRDFAEADRLRDEIQAAGWVVRDSPGGPELIPRGAPTGRS